MWCTNEGASAWGSRLRRDALHGLTAAFARFALFLRALLSRRRRDSHRRRKHAKPSVTARQQIKNSSQPNTLGPQPKFNKTLHLLSANISVQTRSLAYARTRALHRSLYFLHSSVTLCCANYSNFRKMSELRFSAWVTANSHEGVNIRHALKKSVMRMYRNF